MEENTETSYYAVQCELKNDKPDRIVVIFENKYILDKNKMYSVRYDSEYLILNSFACDVYRKSFNKTKCIQENQPPARSYRGIVSWYNARNIIGCNINKTTIVFNVKNDQIDLSHISNFIALDR